ncbi:hypothetical protein [Haloarcula argentinensis]|uniref:Uncharacterized protein n=1 Tax=Haloarcula argentinensis TaxID=43776 RepID=A0A830FQD8_HALAR|nr:hypothetical protein [Haloarcula argentinensis]GGM46341.1 hypothetical protein GCM10009006_29530 [Haloarcula argentinensis]
MTEVLDIRSLPRARRERLQRSKSFGDVAEEIVAEVYGLEGLSLDPDWWDLRHPSRTTKYQVKSTSTTVGNRYPGDGRFRVWEGQTRSLIASDAQTTAWYAFVFLDETDGVLRITRMKPSTVNNLVQDRGGWNRSGHSMGEQHKIPWDEVF